MKDNEYLKLLRSLISGKKKTTKGDRKPKKDGIDFNFKKR